MIDVADKRDVQGVSNDSWTQACEPVFIVGAPRGGTTWLQALLGSHPQIVTGPETHFFKALAGADAIYRLRLPRPVGLQQYLPDDEFYKICAQLFHQVTSRIPRPQQPVRYFLEKTPEHALHAEFILRCFPQARFIHVIRDARHVTASLIRTARAFGSAPGRMNASIAAHVWRECVLSAERIAKNVTNPNQYVEVKYEELRRDPHRKLGDLLQSLDLEVSADDVSRIIELNTLDRSKRESGFDAIKSPRSTEQSLPEPNGFFGSGAAEPAKFELSRLQRFQVERLTGDLLLRHGYCASYPRVPNWAVLACSWKIRRLIGLRPV